jgi:hypothetical protein
MEMMMKGSNSIYPEITTSNLIPIMKDTMILKKSLWAETIRSNSVKKRINRKQKKMAITVK